MTNEEILKALTILENAIHERVTGWARQWALELDREILGDEDEQ